MGGDMILIDGEWERVETKDDCIRIIKDKLGEEFAEKTSNIFFPQSKDTLKQVVSDLIDIKNDLEYAIQAIEEGI